MFWGALFSALVLETFAFIQSGSDGNCYSVNVKTDPTLHKLTKTITLCDGTDLPLDFDPIPVLTTNNQSLNCPDTKTQIVAFAPNENEIEQNVTLSVYRVARSFGYHTALLILDNATITNFLSFAKCPHLIGLFYDGDADNESILAHDGLIYYTDIAKLNWRYQVLSYWLACEAYNEPMLSAVSSIHPRKWAAGINDLMIGPSDVAASVAFQWGIQGLNIEEAFYKATTKYDIYQDDWGFGGFGSNVLKIW